MAWHENHSIGNSPFGTPRPQLSIRHAMVVVALLATMDFSVYLTGRVLPIPPRLTSAERFARLSTAMMVWNILALTLLAALFYGRRLLEKYWPPGRKD